jgi:putative flippase GtrA
MIFNLILKKIQFIKFIIVGVLNTIVGYGIYWAMLQLDFNFTIAALVSTLIGIIFNFFTMGRLVFNSENNVLFYKFVFVVIFLYLISIAGISFMHNFDISYEIAGAIILIPRAILSYILNKNVVFKK